MKREIKFRAWDRVTKKMMEDPYVGIPGANSLTEAIEGITEEQGNILMQFTGLTDSNGKEIYEGDIVTKHERFTERFGEKNYSVIYLERVAAFCIQYEVDGELYASYIGNDLSDFEVIGNVFENPELLQVLKPNQ